MNKRKIAVVCAIIFAVIFAGLYLYIYTLPSITGALTPTEVVEYGQMQITLDADALIVREEKLITAEHTGDVAYFVDENIKTRKGSKIAEVMRGGSSGAEICPETGIVSYFTDGYEDLSPDITEDLTAEFIQSVEPDLINVTADHITRGAVLYKLITSDVWYTVFNTAKEEARSFRVGQNVKIVINGTTVDAKVHTVYAPEIAESATITISSGKYYQQFSEVRREKVSVILQDKKGIIIPNTAITYQNEKPGVFVKDIGGDFVFTRIEVLCDNGEQSCITPYSFTEKNEEGKEKEIISVAIYDEILKHAEGE